MPVADELRADPLAFLRHYYLVLSPELWDPQPPDRFQDGTVRIRLEDTTDNYSRAPTRPRNRKGLGKLMAKYGGSGQTTKATRHYTLRLARPQDIDVVAAYICPYRPGAALQATVGAAADLMFTAEMSGCTFGVGSSTPTGLRTVVHANDFEAGNAGGEAGQAAAQLTATRAALPGGTGHALQPTHYRTVNDDAETRATVMGVRQNGDWEFWAQKFSFDFQSMDLMSVVRFA